jgi:chromosome partitioning protein
VDVVCFLSQKGGSGKSTLAIGCAVSAKEAGKRALILDLDPQGTAEAWYQDREDDEPQLVKLEASQLEEALLTAARANRCDIVLIDTPGRDEPSIAAAIRAADLCIIPCRPTPADMKACPPTVATITRINKPAAFVLTQTPPRSYRIREAEQGLSVLGIVAPVHTVMRNTYQDAIGAGLGPTEFEPDGKAAEEAKALWQWLAKKVRKVKHAKKTDVA